MLEPKSKSQVLGEQASEHGSYVDNLRKAREGFLSFLERFNHSSRITILHDFDADGVSAGVVLSKTMQRAGFQHINRAIPNRERSTWINYNEGELPDNGLDALFVLDLGCSSKLILDGVPTCFIDHHRPADLPDDAVLISGYTWEPPPNTSLIVHELCKSLVNVDDLDWIACIGTISDLGERAPFDLVREAKTKYGAKWLKEATTLVNAARRAEDYDPESAARALLAASSPRDMVTSESSDVEKLRAARAEVSRALNDAKKAAPIFSGKVALIRVNSKCQVHPLIAQIWRTRLPRYIVIAANESYIPGKINFSVRSSVEVNVLDFLNGLKLSPGEGQYGEGHDQASGGSLPVKRWKEMLTKLGFPVGAMEG